MDSDIFGSVLDLFAMVVCVVYPIWRSYKVVEAKKFDNELIRWLVYWVLFSFVTKTEDFFSSFFSLLLGSAPQSSYFYRVSRISFFAWLMHPKYQGSRLIYHRYLEPQFSANQELIQDSAFQLLSNASERLVSLELKVKKFLSQLQQKKQSKEQQD